MIDPNIIGSREEKEDISNTRKHEDVEREIVREEKEIDRNRVEYSACFLDDKGMQDMRRGLEENGIELIGIEQPDMHMTLQYYGRNPDKSGIPEGDMGKVVLLRVVSYGVYRTEGNDNGKIENQGFKIDKDSLNKIVLSDGRTLGEVCKNEVPHITLSLSLEKNEEGKYAKAVNTNNAKFDTPLQPFYIEARIGVCGFGGDGVGYKIKATVEEEEKLVQQEQSTEKWRREKDIRSLKSQL